jgi:hypothetical protein
MNSAMRGLETKPLPKLDDRSTDHMQTHFRLIDNENAILNLMRSIQNDFILIGYRLIQIRDGEHYKVAYDNNCNYYTDFLKYVEHRFDISKTLASNLINVCKRFSEGFTGLSKKYRDYTFSQLVELLPMPDAAIVHFSPLMTIKEMRALKKGDSVYVNNVDGSGSTAKNTHKLPVEFVPTSELTAAGETVVSEKVLTWAELCAKIENARKALADEPEHDEPYQTILAYDACNGNYEYLPNGTIAHVVRREQITSKDKNTVIVITTVNLTTKNRLAVTLEPCAHFRRCTIGQYVFSAYIICQLSEFLYRKYGHGGVYEYNLTKEQVYAEAIAARESVRDCSIGTRGNEDYQLIEEYLSRFFPDFPVPTSELTEVDYGVELENGGEGDTTFDEMPAVPVSSENKPDGGKVVCISVPDFEFFDRDMLIDMLCDIAAGIDFERAYSKQVGVFEHLRETAQDRDVLPGQFTIDTIGGKPE